MAENKQKLYRKMNARYAEMTVLSREQHLRCAHVRL